MKILIFLIIVFLIIVYLFTYIRYKRLHRKQINTVQAFHDTYDTACRTTNNQTACDHINTDCVDFVDKEDFISGIQAEIKENNQPTRKTIVPRELKF